jgi:thiamine phosphate synthase YjbQ (UPF0047 family)
LFEKIHEADAKTIDDLMAYVDKLVDKQDALMHDLMEKTMTIEAPGHASDLAKPM